MFRKLTALVLVFWGFSLAAERRIAVIVDTSGSMTWNDHSRFAVQISKILSDLVDDQDRLAIIRFPGLAGGAPAKGGNLLDQLRSLFTQEQGGAQDCSVGANPSLMVELRGSDRESFKSRVDGLLQYNGPTYFGAPLRTAIPFLGEDRGTQRLLLLVSDAEEGFGSCKQQYTQLLESLGGTGATVALIKLGGYADDGFANNPAIQFREDVQDSAKLIGAVAQVYQRFLGSKQVQVGRVSGEITVQIAPHVKDAYLVVAADSPLGMIRAGLGNPAADRIDLDYRGGGQTRAVGRYQNPQGPSGVDNDLRGYRIVHLVNPTPGSYSFTPPPGTTGGWMLLQDYALDLRMISQKAPSDSTTPVQFEIIDQRTGQRVTDAPTLSGLRLDGKIESSIVSLTNNGSGIFAADHHFGAEGRVPVQMRLRTGSIDKTYNVTIEVTKNAPPPPAPVPAPQQPQPAQQAPLAPPPLPPPPNLANAGDIEFGQPAPVGFGRLTSESAAQISIEFMGGRVANDVEVLVSTDLNKRQAQMEIQTRDGWRPISATPLPMPLAAGSPMQFPLRMHVGGCPQGCSASETHHVSFVVHRADGVDQRAEVPIQVEIVPEKWYICWRRELLTLLALIAAGILAHGFLSPFRFPSRAGVQMSPAEDLTEGFFFPLRAAKGSGPGFYRDAVLYLTEDFRVTGQKRGAFARLHARKSQISIRPVNGRPVLRQQADGSWEPLNASQDATARAGVTFRNDGQTLYFEVRTK